MRAPPGVVDTDDGRADAHGQVHHLADLLGVRLGERSAEDGEVLAEDEHQAPVDAAVAGDHAIAQDALLVEPEVGGSMRHERVELHERAGVEKQVQPLACGQLALGVLLRDTLDAASHARLCAQLVEARDLLAVGWHGFLTLPDLSQLARKAYSDALARAPRHHSYPQKRWKNCP